MKERISHFLASVNSTHSSFHLQSFSSGNLASILVVANMISKKGREVDGPSAFSSASGTPRFVPVCLHCVGKLRKMVDPWPRNHLNNELRITG